ncbi:MULTISPECIES: DUF6327 family protein [Myroides]|uniref:Uncharacterized protein n=1 Tax=Myroides odoratus TaxID=256 RepID=A0A378RS16_MYROD|nr:DUF6327 family protein [Myroides odoratus]MDH6602310.1 hypothetical protein [Myroides gitamensis]EHQ42524.1 hypothetical protein Myrod_1691 [Myroides odoratus DSM 2801]EKB07905.1 hypothetical protein HMPREF9716_01547 [Myroides odoratus CIP 103059]MCS4239309.1 hypothetical protein [Myroides odoratus]QQT99896.1 hypothetical protein I6I88_17305 [Myroides odoratus]
MRKSYSSFEQINQDLQILRIEREIHYQKINLAFDELKEDVAPQNLIKNTLGSAGSLLRNSGGIQTLLVTSILKYFIRKFRK